MKCIMYKSGYKYQLCEDYIETIDIFPNEDIDYGYIRLSIDGNFFIKKGYAWDGASGKARDTKTNMRGALVHDALYQLMRNYPNEFPRENYRIQADKLFKKMLQIDGMFGLRVLFFYLAVRWFGDSSAGPDQVVIPDHAPKRCPETSS